MLSENGEVIKNRHDRAPDHSTVSIQNGGQTLPCGFSLGRKDFQSFDALACAFNPAEAPFRFHKNETKYFKDADHVKQSALGFSCFPAVFGIV